MALKVLDRKALEDTSVKARESERLRMNLNLHELSDPVQRMINAIEPASYIRPHRHSAPPKVELFMILKGKGAVLLFDDSGKVIECALLVEGGDTLAAEVEPGAWHTVVSLESGTIFFEIKDGPYEPITDKDFAPWAPEPNDEEVAHYLEGLKNLALKEPS